MLGLTKLFNIRLNHLSGQIAYLSKVLNERKKQVLVISNYFRQPNILISKFKCILDYNNCEKYSQSPFFIYKCTNQVGKQTLFLGKLNLMLV